MNIIKKFLCLVVLAFVCNNYASSRIHSLSHGAEEEGPAFAEGMKGEGKEKESKEESKENARDEKKEGVKEKESFSFPTFSEISNKIANIDWSSILVRFLRIVIILASARAVWKGLKLAISNHLQKIMSFQRKKNNTTEQSPLFKTIVPIIESIVRGALMILTALVVLSDIGVDIAPIILSFSVVGIAISLGSQELVKDIINGVLTLFDGNIAVGDTVRIGGHVGIVETMSLRAIVLRHGSGELQTIPFSEAKGIVNCSRGFNFAEIAISVAPDANMHHVDKAFFNVFDSMKKSKEFGDKILSDLAEVGVKSITAAGVVAVGEVKIKPDPEKLFTKEYLKLLFMECQKLHIPLAYNPFNPELYAASNDGGEAGGSESSSPEHGD